MDWADGRPSIHFNWFIDGVYHGTAPRRSHDRYFRLPRAKHYGCPACGKIWAECVPAPDVTHRIHHTFLHVPCPSCCVIGSIHPFEKEINELPRPMLLFELLTAAQHPKEWSICSRQLKQDMRT